MHDLSVASIDKLRDDGVDEDEPPPLEDMTGLLQKMHMGTNQGSAGNFQFLAILSPQSLRRHLNIPESQLSTVNLLLVILHSVQSDEIRIVLRGSCLYHRCLTFITTEMCRYSRIHI